MFKYLRTSKIYYFGQLTEIEVWKELKSNKIRIINTKTREKISLNNLMGSEI